MTTRKRNYAAEYARRIARGKARGMSVSQSRGHPKKRTVTAVLKGGRDKGKTVKRIEIVEVGAAAIRAANARARKRGIRPILDAGATIEDIKRAVLRDAQYVFEDVPKREHGDGSAPEYQLRLEQLASRPGAFDWKNEAKFIAEMQALGLSEKQAYSQWFSPGGKSA